MARIAKRGSALLVLVSALMLDAQAGAAQGAVLPLPVEIRVPKPPSVASGDASRFLAYELFVTNLGMDTLTLTRIDVLADAGASPIATVADSTLIASLVRPGVRVPAADRPRIAGGLRAVAFMWVPVAGQTAPRTLRHRLSFQRSGADKSVTIVTTADVPVTTDVVSVGPPLRGGVWLAANGPDASSGHRRAMIVAEVTEPHVAQRFAIDYVKLGDNGKTYRGDSLANASYYAYGTDALAVADGNVLVVKDGIPENVPGSRAVPITLETVGGNHVIIDLGRGRYAFYAHLQPGSIRVKTGDRVKRGQVLGLVGNSGNSTEPHLHFHISDSPSPLGSEGLPYLQENVELVGACKSLFDDCAQRAPAKLVREMPTANQLVRFP